MWGFQRAPADPCTDSGILLLTGEPRVPEGPQRGTWRGTDTSACGPLHRMEGLLPLRPTLQELAQPRQEIAEQHVVPWMEEPWPTRGAFGGGTRCESRLQPAVRKGQMSLH